MIIDGFFVICIVGERRIKCHLHEIAKLLANMYTNMYGFIFKRFVYIFHIDVISMCQCPNKLEEKQTCFSRMISYTISFYPWCMDLFLILTTLKCLFHFSFHLFAYNCFCSFFLLCSSHLIVVVTTCCFSFSIRLIFPKLVICSCECVESGIWILL